MSVEITLRTYNGEVLERGAVRLGSWERMDSNQRLVLWGIDLEGLTIFNSLQMSQLIAEIDAELPLAAHTAGVGLAELKRLCEIGKVNSQRKLWLVR